VPVLDSHVSKGTGSWYIRSMQAMPTNAGGRSPPRMATRIGGQQQQQHLSSRSVTSQPAGIYQQAPARQAAPILNNGIAVASRASFVAPPPQAAAAVGVLVPARIATQDGSGPGGYPPTQVIPVNTAPTAAVPAKSSNASCSHGGAPATGVSAAAPVRLSSLEHHTTATWPPPSPKAFGVDNARAPLTSPRRPSPCKATSPIRTVHAVRRSRRGASMEPGCRPSSTSTQERSCSTSIRQAMQRQPQSVQALPVMPKSGSSSSSALPTAASFEAGLGLKQVDEVAPRLTRHDSASASAFAPPAGLDVPTAVQVACAATGLEKAARKAGPYSNPIGKHNSEVSPSPYPAYSWPPPPLSPQMDVWRRTSQPGYSIGQVPPPYPPLQFGGPTRARSVAVSSVSRVSSGVVVEPEAEPAALAGSFGESGSSSSGPHSKILKPQPASIRIATLSPPDAGHGDTAIVSLEDDNEDDCFSPEVTLHSAKIAALTDDSLQLHVRLMPSEIVRWSELEILQGISTGSFGEVFLANYRGDQVSVKRCILGEDGSMTKEQLRNLEREINTYRTLDHPSIVKYIGCVLEHPNLAIVTEYAPNGNVFDLLYTHRVNLPAAIRLKIASQVSLALYYMHSCDPIVIHRDLKTQNLVLDADYSVKLCDFGKTQSLDSNTTLLLQQDNGGSPRYMAPECFKRTAYITEKVDIWSLGCCLIEVFGGPLPYEEVPQMANVLKVMLMQRKPPLVPPWFVPKVRPILARCFDFEPQLRPAVFEVQLVLKRLTPDEMERHGMDTRRTH